MSRQAIAAALAREDLTGGERLVAFSLASFAGRDDRAWPGAPAGAARAGLSRSRYLYDRGRLVKRGLIDVAEQASGRGRASTVALRFAMEGPWWEGEINAELFEAVLSRTQTRGPARLLLAVMAALADGDGVVLGVLNEELCAAAGLEDRTYRRARPQLLESGELVLLSAARGRANTNVWEVRPLAAAGEPGRGTGSQRRVVAPARQRPLLAAVSSGATVENGDRAGGPADATGRQPAGSLAQERPGSTGFPGRKGGPDRTVSGEKCPVWSGVSPAKGGQDRTLFELAAPANPGRSSAENPAENPASHARAGREPQNPRTGKPPKPPEGGANPAR